MDFTIDKTWDGEIPPDSPQIQIKLCNSTKGLVISVNAPFFGDPEVPKDIPVGPTPQLWDYEVVELFFMGENDNYLEVELGPKGHYLILQLSSYRKITVESVTLPPNSYETNINVREKRWTGLATIPYELFPQKVQKMNAYAIHKSDPERVYMSLYPVDKGKYDYPDFHRLKYFQKIKFQIGN